MINKTRAGVFSLSFIFCLGTLPCAYASAGTEGAAFLDIPIGGRPAALGAAYSALATDAYAATINPAGLGTVDSTQLSGQHLSYLDTLHYEYLSFAHSLKDNQGGIGGSVQYLGTGSITGRDENGNPIGSVAGSYAAYNLAYGRKVTDKLSLGATGKIIHAQLDDVSANAYAADFGSLYKLADQLTVAATLTNLGSKLKFLSAGDPLPLAAHLGAAYQFSDEYLMTAEAIYPQTGLASFHMGAEWRPVENVSLRAGYRTDTVKELSALAGLTTGIGLEVLGQEVDYAFLPMGDLGSTHYFSLLMKFGRPSQGRNLIQYHALTHPRVPGATLAEDSGRYVPDSQQLMDLLSANEESLAWHASH